MRFLITVTLLLCALSSQAVELTLTRALELAETHSHTRKQAQANSAAAARTVTATRAERFPTLAASAYATRVDEIPILDIEIPRLFSIRREIGTLEHYQADLRVTLPVWTGGRIGSAIALARANRTYWQALESLDLNALQYATRTEYFGLYRSLRLREAADASLKRTAIIRMDVRSMYAAGVVDSVDILEANLAFTTADFAARQADILVRTAEIHLLTRLGLTTGERLILIDSVPEPPLYLTAYPGSTERPEKLAAQAGIDLNAARVRQEKAEYFPTVAIFGGYAYGKPNQNMFEDKWNDYFTIGASLSWKFNLGFKTKQNTARAGLELEAARHYYQRVDEQVTQEGRLAFEQLKMAHEQYMRTREEHRIARANYDLASSRHVEGDLSSNRLLEIETTLTTAESALAAAVADFYIAESAYLYTIGSENLGKGL